MAAITSAEIVYRYSVTTGAAGDSAAGTQAGNLGKYVSQTAIPDATLNAVFPDITGAQNAASQVDYAPMVILNNNAANALQNAVVYVASEVAGGASITIATDNIAASAKGSASAQLAQIANSLTAPTGVSAYSAPTTLGTGLSLGSIPVANVKAFWLKRSAANTSALSNDGVTVTVGGDTGSL